MKKLLIASLAALALAAPAAAATVDEMVKHGVVLTIADMEIDVTYTADGKFTAAEGQVTGTWTMKGEQMCTTSNFDPNETCVAIPADKKSGDSFEVTSPAGTATMKIK